jgi:predicted nucleotidyltransferase component of viral defense system
MSERGGRAESIRHRLRNLLRERGEDVATGLQRYAAERFLYRLGRSTHRDRFVLKGATLFAIWGTAWRPTRDLDFTGYDSPKADDVLRCAREICRTPDELDELVFDTDAITAEPIRDDSAYQGLRLRIPAWLGQSKVQLQVDIGFGNAIIPAPVEAEYRTLLGDPAPRILAYPQEAVVAEKLHAMVIMGERNSRYKDFYDIHALAAGFAFDRDTVERAVRGTFERRATPFPTELPAALTTPFYSDDTRVMQWRAYVTRNNLSGTSPDFVMIGERIILFLGPVWEAIVTGPTGAGNWLPPGPWRYA